MQSPARFAVIALAALLAAGAAHAQSQGPNNVLNPLTIVNDASIGTIAWSAPGQAATSDNLYANVNLNAGQVSQYLKATDFGFSIPAAAVILGIEVDIEKVAVGGNAFDNAVRIVEGGAIGTNDHSLGMWPGADTVVTYGSPSDLWGETWTPADINGAGFGAAISAHDSVSGVLARVDEIAITVFYGLCGDTIVAPNEDCDDGNVTPGDCCDSLCQYEATGSPCPGDGQPCTTDLCNATGTCLHANQPHGGCRTSQKAVLVYKNDASDDNKDKLTWKWIKGQTTTFAELGLPTGTTAYTLCLYDNNAALGDATVPGGAPKWAVIGANKGYKYKDKPGTADGIRKVILKASAANKSKALVKGKGVNLPDLPALPFALPVTAQLVNDANNVCFTTVFNTAKKNVGSTFKAKSP
jgi:cysteine-rich repeat protein